MIIDASQFFKHLSLLLRVCNNRCRLHFNTKLMCKKKKKKKKKKLNFFYFFFFIKKSIMNFSESRQNRSRENREKSKNRFFSPTPIIHHHTTSPERTLCTLQTLSHVYKCSGMLTADLLLPAHLVVRSAEHTSEL